MIIRKIPKYDFGVLDFKQIDNADFLKNKFYISLPVLPSTFEEEKTLLFIPGALELRVINRSFGDSTVDIRSIRGEECFYFNEDNEWILEAVCHMQTNNGNVKKDCVIRLPMSAPFVKDAEIGLYFDGTWIRFMKNGEILNENSGMDEFCMSTGDIFIDTVLYGIKAAKVERVSVTYYQKRTEASADFYLPVGWNTDVGDVMSFFHNGTYHLMYLLDRRHHGSRNGCGAHYICHMTSDNMTDWYEQEPIVQIDKPWITYGTGTMLYQNGKYYMTYGLHTERYEGKGEKTTPEYDEKTGKFKNITFDEIFERGGLPAGASYSVSDNGIDFKPSNVLFHSSRNPSAYINEKGGITLYCGSITEGVFNSESFEKPFVKSKESFSYSWKSVMKNNSDCPAFFSWNGYKYLLVGFTGYFRTLSPGSDKFVDAAALGEYIYDGLSVPMVTEYRGNRRIMSGWVRSPLGLWGGVLMQRELVEEENGKLGMKWVPEFTPQIMGDNIIKATDNIYNGIRLYSKKSYYLDMTVEPESVEKMGVCLNDGKHACTLEVNFKKSRIQVNDAPLNEFAKEIPTMLEQMQKADKNIKTYSEAGVIDIPQRARNYCLSDIPLIDKAFTLKILLRYSKRLRSTVIDSEIAGRRTIISVRDGFFPTEISVISKGDILIKNLSLKEINVVE